HQGTRYDKAPLGVPVAAPGLGASVRRADFVEDRPQVVDGVVLDDDRIGTGRCRDGDADRVHAGVSARIADYHVRRSTQRPQNPQSKISLRAQRALRLTLWLACVTLTS